MSVLTPQQLQVVHGLLSQIDPNAGGPPEGAALQEGGTEATPRSLGRVDPAQARGRMGRDATSGYGPTDAGQGQRDMTYAGSAPRLPLDRPTGYDRRRITRDSGPPSFNGMPTIDGRGPRPDGFAHDSVVADRELRRRLRMAGHPLGDHGGPGTALSYAKACGLGHLAMDAAPQPSGDANAGLEAASRISELSYMGRMIHSDPPRAPGHGMAYDQASDPLSLGAMMPGLAARFAIQEANEHRAFAVARSTPDDRFPRRRSRGGGVPMAYDSRPAGRSAAPSISAVFGPELAARLDGIGFVR